MLGCGSVNLRRGGLRNNNHDQAPRLHHAARCVADRDWLPRPRLPRPQHQPAASAPKLHSRGRAHPRTRNRGRYLYAARPQLGALARPRLDRLPRRHQLLALVVASCRTRIGLRRIRCLSLPSSGRSLFQNRGRVVTPIHVGPPALFPNSRIRSQSLGTLPMMDTRAYVQ